MNKAGNATLTPGPKSPLLKDSCQSNFPARPLSLSRWLLNTHPPGVPAAQACHGHLLPPPSLLEVLAGKNIEHGVQTAADTAQGLQELVGYVECVHVFGGHLADESHEH